MRRYVHTWDLMQVKETDDGMGGADETTDFVKKVQVWLSPIQGTRSDQYSQVINGKPYEIKMRFTNELDSSQGDFKRIKKDYFFKNGDRELIIHDIINVSEQSKFLDLVVWEKA